MLSKDEFNGLIKSIGFFSKSQAVMKQFVLRIFVIHSRVLLHKNCVTFNL